jgi:hypothetical protein
MSSEGMGGKIFSTAMRKATPKTPSEDTMPVAHAVMTDYYPAESLK